jgi:hypothetical protein
VSEAWLAVLACCAGHFSRRDDMNLIVVEFHDGLQPVADIRAILNFVEKFRSVAAKPISMLLR